MKFVNLVLLLLGLCTSGAWASSKNLLKSPDVSQEDILEFLAEQDLQIHTAGFSSFLDQFHYPKDSPLPSELEDFIFEIPFEDDLWIKCQQGNNTLYWEDRGASHGPDKRLRYSLDLNVGSDVSGTSVMAAASGQAFIFDGARHIGEGDNGVFDGRHLDNGGLGNFVAIDHQNGFASLYAHLDEITISNGDFVVSGDEIGLLGRTGGSGGHAHLHFQVNPLRQDIQTPRSRLTPEEFNTLYFNNFAATVPFLMKVRQISLIVANSNLNEKVIDSRFFETDFYGVLPVLPTSNANFWYKK